MSDQEQSQGICLTDELATEAILRAMGRVNKIRNANLNGDETDMLLFNTLGSMLGITPLKVANDVYLDSTVAYGAMMLRLYIRGEAARKGLPSNMGEEMQKPSITDHIFNREKVEKYDRFKKEMEAA